MKLHETKSRIQGERGRGEGGREEGGGGGWIEGPSERVFVSRIQFIR